jgi:hypothetical protein
MITLKTKFWSIVELLKLSVLYKAMSLWYLWLVLIELERVC